MLRLPVVVAEVRGLGHELLLSLKVRLEVFGFQAVGVVYIPRDLLPFGVLVAEEDNRSQLAISNEILALGQVVQKGVV